MKHRILSLFLLLALCLLLPGCKAPAQQPLPDPTPAPDLSLSFLETPQDDAMDVRLYFRYQHTPYLAAEERTLHVSRSQAPEKAVVEALIRGPEAASVSLSGLFPPDTQVLSTSVQDGTLFLTFNDALLSRYPDEPGGTGNEEYIQRRKLCMASLVNTLTECGLCTRVQVLVDQSTSAVTSLRLPASFFRDTEDETPLGPIYRDESVILTPYNTACRIMDAWLRRSHDELYSYLCARSGGENRPGQNQAYEQFDHSPSLTSFTLSPGVTSADGKHAVFSLNMTLFTGGQDLTVTAFPLQLEMENGLWRISYDHLLTLFGAAQ